MLAGDKDADALRKAAADERAAIAALIDSARSIASNDERKLSPATLDRVAETLQAANADTRLAERVRAGRLDKEARSATLGVSPRAPARGRGTKATARKDERRAEREQARLELEAARRDLERAEARRDRAQDEVDKQTRTARRGARRARRGKARGEAARDRARARRGRAEKLG